MLTNEEVEQARGVIRKCIYGIPDSEGQVARDTLDRIVDELLAMQSLPEMSEVDAEYEGCFDGADHAASSSDAVKRLADIARRAIANAESERKRVAELEEVLRLREMSGIDGKEPTDG